MKMKLLKSHLMKVIIWHFIDKDNAIGIKLRLKCKNKEEYKNLREHLLCLK
jgi:hypothetical protein